MESPGGTTVAAWTTRRLPAPSRRSHTRSDVFLARVSRTPQAQGPIRRPAPAGAVPPHGGSAQPPGREELEKRWHRSPAVGRRPVPRVARPPCPVRRSSGRPGFDLGSALRAVRDIVRRKNREILRRRRSGDADDTPGDPEIARRVRCVHSLVARIPTPNSGLSLMGPHRGEVLLLASGGSGHGGECDGPSRTFAARRRLPAGDVQSRRHSGRPRSSDRAAETNPWNLIRFTPAEGM